MRRFFEPPSRAIINYVKMYSTFRTNTSEHCFAYILMPSSRERELASINNLQWDFNADGQVIALRIFYEGLDNEIKDKAQVTIAGLKRVQKQFGVDFETCVFNPIQKNLKLDLALAEKDFGYLTSVVDVVATLYYLQDDFLAELKLQLLDKDYLAKEYKRLGGRTGVADKSPTCLLM